HAGRQPVDPVLQGLPPAEIDKTLRAAGDRSRGTVMITEREVNRDRLVALARLEQPVRRHMQRLAAWHRPLPQRGVQGIAPVVSDARPAILERLDPGALW